MAEKKKRFGNGFCAGLVAGLCVILFCFGDFPLNGIQNILITYITINTAILAVAFAVVVIKNGSDNQSTLPKDYFNFMVSTAFGIYTSLYVLFMSYSPFMPPVGIKIGFMIPTATTFIVTISMLNILYEMNPSNQ